MAIQFHCPSCEAMIRVPDAAAGKRGTCPRCNEKLMVPDVLNAQAPNAIPAPVAAPQQQFEAPRATPGLPRLEPFAPTATVPSAGPTIGLSPLDPGPSISSGMRRKPKPKQSLAGLIVPALCILGVAGFLAWYIWDAQPKLEGELVATVVHDLEVQPGQIPGEVSGLDKDDLGEVLRHLKAEPVHWASATSKITITATNNKAAEVSIRNGAAAHFVAVSPTKSPALLEYVKQNLDALDKPRLASVEKNAPRLFEAWKRQFTKNDPITDQKTYRDLVLLPVLVSGLGYHVEALVNGNIYPCVYTDEDGVLYFLLPNATKSFVLHGRKVAGGLSVPANFKVKISGATEAAPVRKKPKRKTAAEREAENEGMNPELEESESADAPETAAVAQPMDLGNTSSDGMPADGMNSDGMNSDGMAADGMAADGMSSDGMAAGGMSGKPTAKSKSATKSTTTKNATKKKSGMMGGEAMDGGMMEGDMTGGRLTRGEKIEGALTDGGMMDDEMPAKSRPKKKAVK